MKLKFTNNFRILEVIQATKIELEQLTLLSTAKWISYNGKVREQKTRLYFHKYTYLLGGFWHKVFSLNKIGYTVKIDGLHEFVRNISIEDFNDWIDELALAENRIPRWYQRKGAWLAIKYRVSRGEFATSAGKSLILYLVARYCLEKLLPESQSILIVVPSVQLVTQLAKDFESYQTDDYIQVDKIYGGSKRNKTARVKIGNIDSLSNYDSDFFTEFGAIFFDEAHKLATEGYQQIIEYMSENDIHCIYSVSGTFHDAKNANDFPAEAISGPILIRVPAHQLMAEGSIAKLKILVINLIYNAKVSEMYYNHEDNQYVNRRYDFELKYIRQQAARFKMITRVIGTLEFNQLVLFKSVEYCKRFHEYLKHTYPDKQVLLIHGDVSTEKREAIVRLTEENTNCIICATYGTMSTGISINNLFNFHLAESSKSFIVVRQSIGRILRLHPSKNYAQVIDWVDKFKRLSEHWGGPKHRNIASNHARFRQKIYDQQKFEWSSKDITLD